MFMQFMTPKGKQFIVDPFTPLSSHCTIIQLAAFGMMFSFLRSAGQPQELTFMRRNLFAPFFHRPENNRFVFS
jgi:hypothetical protein